MPSLSWKKAARLAGLCLTQEQKTADDWPAAFELKQISALQYPGDGTPTGARAAREDRKALLEVLEASVKSGEVLTEQRARKVEVFREIPVRRCPHEGVDKSVSGVSNEEWAAIGGRFKRVPNGLETVYYNVVLPAGLCDWFAEQKEAPSEHIRAWVGSFGVVASEEQNELPTLTVMKRTAIINNLSRKYPSLESDFNRPADWVKDCRTSKRGEYFLEKVEAGCRSKWGNGSAPGGPVASIRTHKIRA